jgi:hypothetical protein
MALDVQCMGVEGGLVEVERLLRQMQRVVGRQYFRSVWCLDRWDSSRKAYKLDFGTEQIRDRRCIELQLGREFVGEFEGREHMVVGSRDRWDTFGAVMYS